MSMNDKDKKEIENNLNGHTPKELLQGVNVLFKFVPAVKKSYLDNPKYPHYLSQHRLPDNPAKIVGLTEKVSKINPNYNEPQCTAHLKPGNT